MFPITSLLWQVTGIMEFGCFVLLDLPGKFEGLVHASQLADKRVIVADYVKKDQKVKVKILNR